MTLKEFNKITDAEDFLEFFDLDYDEKLVNVKRFHIMRKFGEDVAKINETYKGKSEDELLGFYKFSLVRVYKSFENGYEPSAAEVWKMLDKPNPCLACSTLGDCSPKEMDDATKTCG
jgi:nitrogenase-stabilizing/protective protein